MLKPDKASGPDSICPELIIHVGAALKSWLNNFLFPAIPKICRRALVVAVPKPMKPLGKAKSYGSISLLRVPFKIMERLIYARIEPIVNLLLPQEQAAFRRGRSTTDQVTLLTQGIEDSFSAKKKAGAAFVNLTAAYMTLYGTVTSPASSCAHCLSRIRLNLSFPFESAHKFLMNLNLNLNFVFSKSMNLNLNFVFSKSMNLNSKLNFVFSTSMNLNTLIKHLTNVQFFDLNLPKEM